ncbi:MAG: YHYH protein, partial [Gemmataceae bacterium]|nr:YHYH protein [Gemmataceae bacterium]
MRRTWRPNVLKLEDRIAPATGIALIDSWLRDNTAEYAKIINGANTAAGPVTTWPGNTTPVLGDVQAISSSASYVYVQAPTLASYVMGPWYLANGSVFPNYPTNQNRLVRFNRAPAAATSHVSTPLGTIGMWVNGVNMFNMLDAFGWKNSTQADATNFGDGYWERDANPAEGPTFDHANGHQPQSGEYHYHSNPTALRAQLEDNIAYEGTSVTFPYDPNTVYGPVVAGEGSYHEHTDNLHHSPILGWSFDGYPVYGPYGYSDPNDAGSAISRMTSSYRLRTITARTSLPGWAAKAKFGDSVTLNGSGEYPLASNFYGPTINATYPLGRYVQDYEFVSGLGSLDVYNGRFTKTPEFPNGTYAYFVTVDEHGDGVFPYYIGRQYYGQVTSGRVTSITESVTTQFTSTSPAQGGNIRGVVYTDADSSQTRGFSELGRSGITVFVDANGNNALDTGETTAVTGIDGGFDLPVTVNGAYSVRAVAPAYYRQTTPQPAAITVNSGNAEYGVAFGFRLRPPTVSAVQVNDGSAQRSMVTSLKVTFSDPITAGAGAFSLARTGYGSAGTIGIASTVSGSSVTLTFTDGGSINPLINGSLPDGTYRLTVPAGLLTTPGGSLDGNADGTGGDDATFDLHRLYGDATGDRQVD